MVLKYESRATKGIGIDQVKGRLNYFIQEGTILLSMLREKPTHVN
jgi:hypothetical protein